ncbi:TA system antitoxin ParD family protein, partial [Mycobacterium avium]
MAEAVDRVTRVASDLMDSAAAEGARQSRSAKQQLDHWARVGRAVSSQHTASRRRVEAALAGRLSTAELTLEEGVVFNAEISA